MVLGGGCQESGESSISISVCVPRMKWELAASRSRNTGEFALSKTLLNERSKESIACDCDNWSVWAFCNDANEDGTTSSSSSGRYDAWESGSTTSVNSSSSWVLRSPSSTVRRFAGSKSRYACASALYRVSSCPLLGADVCTKISTYPLSLPLMTVQKAHNYRV